MQKIYCCTLVQLITIHGCMRKFPSLYNSCVDFDDWIYRLVILTEYYWFNGVQSLPAKFDEFVELSLYLFAASYIQYSAHMGTVRAWWSIHHSSTAVANLLFRTYLLWPHHWQSGERERERASWAGPHVSVLGCRTCEEREGGLVQKKKKEKEREGGDAWCSSASCWSLPWLLLHSSSPTTII
jgi:hypothetical protein